MANKRDEAIANRPGFVIYFDDMIDALGEYSDAEFGIFVRAMSNYLRTGEVPEFEDRGLRSAFRFVRPKLIHDEESYVKKLADSDYANACKAAKAAEKPLPDREAWERMTGWITTADRPVTDRMPPSIRPVTDQIPKENLTYPNEESTKQGNSISIMGVGKRFKEETSEAIVDMAANAALGTAKEEACRQEQRKPFTGPTNEEEFKRHCEHLKWQFAEREENR